MEGRATHSAAVVVGSLLKDAVAGCFVTGGVGRASRVGRWFLGGWGGGGGVGGFAVLNGVSTYSLVALSFSGRGAASVTGG
jgi:hypothetical protein